MRNSTEFTNNSLAIITNIFTVLSDFQIPMHQKLLKAEVDLDLNFLCWGVHLSSPGTSRPSTWAVNSVPKRSHDWRFVIYVKEGVYIENVVVDKDSWNVMIYDNVVDGIGFIAKDIGFKNTASPEKLQAAALRSSSDQSVFYWCSFDAYQDTLYTYSNHRFYRDRRITGTIDFIFGNAAVVLQNCSI
ncbi:hypothetical protein F0562_029834 [Nyssa sinensis]|uniref:Pectinesterase n=1 Tax=Nyssa sinensis TaxID=561372 RepID=A0A5J5AWJ1_9ASTE|nr:hypothetical protein F0562_029834 [Nyssa sinensis]